MIIKWLAYDSFKNNLHDHSSKSQSPLGLEQKKEETNLAGFPFNLMIMMLNTFSPHKMILNGK